MDDIYDYKEMIFHKIYSLLLNSSEALKNWNFVHNHKQYMI